MTKYRFDWTVRKIEDIEADSVGEAVDIFHNKYPAAECMFIEGEPEESVSVIVYSCSLCNRDVFDFADHPEKNTYHLHENSAICNPCWDENPPAEYETPVRLDVLHDEGPEPEQEDW